MPIVSVIVPAFNAESTISETVTSVINQTFSDFELIIVNDGSKDNTLEAVKSIEDKRIKLLSFENAGVAVARNRGIAHATGKFLTFLDADDLWTSDKLELQLQALNKNPEAGVVYSWTSQFRGSTAKIFSHGNPIFHEENVYEKLLGDHFLASGSNSLVRREAVESVGLFDPACVPCEDWDFHLRLAREWPFCVVPKHQILYRQSSNSASGNIEKMIKASYFVLEKAFSQDTKLPQTTKKKALAYNQRYLAELGLRHGVSTADLNRVSTRLIKAFCLHPVIFFDDHFRFLIGWLQRKWILILLPIRLQIYLKNKKFKVNHTK